MGSEASLLPEESFLLPEREEKEPSSEPFDGLSCLLNNPLILRTGLVEERCFAGSRK